MTSKKKVALPSPVSRSRSSVDRRRFVTAITAGTAAGIGSRVAGKWVKPVVNSVLLPTHAQTSCTSTVQGRLIDAGVQPLQGPPGTTFVIAVSFGLTSPEGILCRGAVCVFIQPPAGDSFYLDPSVISNLPGGTYTRQFQLSTQPTTDQPFAPGQYQLQAAILADTESCSAPNPTVLASAPSQFSITQ